TAAAALATADVNVELAVNRPAGNLDLILMVDVGLRQGTAAVRAGIGERCLVGFIDLLGRLAMGLGAVILAWFAAGLFRLRFGSPLGEGRCLAFARAPLVFKQSGQVFDLGAELGDLAFQ